METIYNPPVELLAARRSRALIIAAIGVVISVAGVLFDRGNFFRSWLIAFMLFLGISLGSMALMMIQHLSGGAWGVFRRIFEASSRTVPVMAVLFIPIALGMQSLYPWSHPDLVASNEILHHRSLYLNTTFWLARAVVFFVGWWLLSATLNRLSARQDAGDVSVNLAIQRVSGAGLVFYALTVTFAGIDWIMSINSEWYSTLFGFLMMGGQGLVSLAFTIIIARMLVPREPMASLLKPHHFHDLGKLMFAFVMLWAYFNFSQFLLTYAANLAEEVPYMITRTSHGWQYLALFLVIFHFAVPWLLLLSRDLKRTPNRLIYIALLIVFVRFVDLFMMISPEFTAAGQNVHMVGGEVESHLFAHWTDIGAPLAVGGIWMWAFFTQLAQRPLLAYGDPYLHESLQSSGGH